jgi:hypothetical protein
MARLYLDTAPIVYHVERTMPFAGAVDARLTAAGVVLVSSELARLECLVLPLKNGDAARVGDFDMFFNARLDELVDFTSAVFRRASRDPRVGQFQDARRTPPGRRHRGRVHWLPDKRCPTRSLRRSRG